MYNSYKEIRLDRDYAASIEMLGKSYKSDTPLPIMVSGLSGGAVTAYLVSAALDTLDMLRESGSSSPIVLLVSTDAERERYTEELCLFGIKAYQYKLREPVFQNISASHDLDRERLSVLSKILSGECDAVVTKPDALLSYSMPQELLSASLLSFGIGDIISPEELSKKLTTMGFVYTDTVEDRGQFSRRGGIVDFFGGEYDAPIRVEFFGDEIDRIVYFDPISQRSADPLSDVTILPCLEVSRDKLSRERIIAELDLLLSKKGISEELKARLLRERGECDSGGGLHFRDRFMGAVYDEPASLMDYISAFGRSVVFVMGTSATKDIAESYLKRLDEARADMLSLGIVTERAARYSRARGDYERFLSSNMTAHINSISGGTGTMKLAGLFGFRTRRTVAYGDNPRLLFEDLLALRHGMYRTVLLAENAQALDALATTLDELSIAYTLVPSGEGIDLGSAAGGRIFITVGRGEGFELLSPKVAVLSMSRDSGRAVMKRKKQQRNLRRLGGAGERLMSHADLSAGDYVVHASYGIGRFEGIETVTVDGVTKDYITIQYAGTDKLFVPCDKLENIGKYIGERNSDGTVKLSKMGGAEWLRTKTRAKAAAKDIADKLIKLYAERQRLAGFAFPKMTELEEEFDNQFEFEETESQLIAIEEIRRDMEKPVPMNRLLCGDVGFGKTEVALRAAFKAILAGKQVALLVPTTILALQHFSTAVSRMRGYAVNIEMLSRFKKPKERQEILRRTERGDVDLLIGTHALLSKNVKFRDLGLLIIDEEQRFGVGQKEKLREMAKNVDTLMLSATPIPRTLNMAMSGISDISVLDEAPGERRPVQTYVLGHDETIIEDAIRRELARGGQVLYLYNKIEDIDLVAGRLGEAIPEARIAYAHGSLDKDEIEDIWHELVLGEIDVLVCTTIIETGVDLPNANTLIIENADNYGLSQLHQIRGRVGRSERQAYAYFTFKPYKTLTPIAERRLTTMREYAEFGAGFKIALRDLEIRGAGNLLGAEQHGYIESVGYDLYLKLLNEAVIEERGDPAEKRFESTVVMDISANIPERYIKTSATRMEMYKKISYIGLPLDRDDVIDEFLDRFGEVPIETERLINIALTRALAEKSRISKVELKGNKIIFTPERARLEIWAEVFARIQGIGFLGVGLPSVVYTMKSGEDPSRMSAKIMEIYYNTLTEHDKKGDDKNG